MEHLYVSSFCVAFRDYDHLAQMIQNCGVQNVGAEFGTSWDYPTFDTLLDEQIPRFGGVPVTLHAPFVEICGAPGSEEAAAMEESFAKAFRWYKAFGATSMVMHTHEKKIACEEKEQLQQYSETAICRTAEKARALGVHLTVENVGYPARGNVLFDQEEFVALIERLPADVGALIDIGHAMANGWRISQLVEHLGSRIKAYHLHNTDGVHDLHRPIYEAGLCYSPEEMEALLRCIRVNTPEADLIFEYAPGAHISAELFAGDIARALRAMKA